MTSWVETCSGRGGWEQVAGVCVKILRSVLQRFPEQFRITFSHKIHLKWVPAGARRPLNQRPGAQVQPRTEFSSIFDPILGARGEPGEYLGDPFEQPWAPPGHCRRHFWSTLRTFSCRVLFCTVSVPKIFEKSAFRRCPDVAKV